MLSSSVFGKSFQIINLMFLANWATELVAVAAYEVRSTGEILSLAAA